MGQHEEAARLEQETGKEEQKIRRRNSTPYITKTGEIWQFYTLFLAELSFHKKHRHSIFNLRQARSSN